MSHDRWFLEKIADRIVLLEGKGLVPYEGSFSEYWRDAGKAASSSRRLGVSRPKLEDRAADLSRKRKALASPGSTQEGAARLGPALETRIGEAEVRASRLEAEAAAAVERGDYQKGSRLAQEAEAAKRLIDKLYEEWAALG